MNNVAAKAATKDEIENVLYNLCGLDEDQVTFIDVRSNWDNKVYKYSEIILTIKYKDKAQQDDLHMGKLYREMKKIGLKWKRNIYADKNNYVVQSLHSAYVHEPHD